MYKRQDGAVAAAGTPDYPHLGYATVAKYPGLPEIAGIAADHRPPPDHEFSPYGKFAVDPSRFRRRFPDAPAGALAPVAAVLHPAIGPGERTEVTARRASVDAEAEVLHANLESAFDGAGWHAYLDDERARVESDRSAAVAALARVPAWDVSGPGDLTSGDFADVIAELEGVAAR
ncbi:hypothetical protein [Glycomyces tenuis]|uniref:hypothetical protein n=1 Tax=Glycomyces tenuis TaxID=58116 RepID=UPI00054D2D67|nr:hypothetical protein [Glycomyces tenuis]